MSLRPPTLAPTTAQSLGALLKSARDIMRKDKGLNGDLDRLPMLTWIMFLKFLDDLELQREQEWKLVAPRKSTPHPGPLPGRGGEGRGFKPAIEAPYRWRDWAAKSDGITGDELLTFINQEECTRPDGKRGAGLFAYLRKLTNSNGDDKREVIATVFGGVDNRMKSGYLLRDVINKIGGIHFTSSGELHTLGSLYESMLREMRDAAGDSGEFYTPRAVVRCMVEVMSPRLGETVLDPACGTGGFLVEAFNHLSKQVKTVADRRTLQDKSLLGCEAKPLPFLLAQMNLLLHGLDAPQIDPGNALRFKLTEIGERDRVDVILTNPPFGGEEEKGVQGNFPEDKQTAETALLFLQLIMRKLRRTTRLLSPSLSSIPNGGEGGRRPGEEVRFARAAVVVPNGTLFGDGVCARIKEELLKEFNLHTIVRLPTLRHQAAEEAEALWARGASVLFDRATATYPVRQLADLVTIRGGGTPSKSDPFYWEGKIPWISPKDMKRRELSDAIDHISERATQESAAKLIEPGAVLVVVRGMILAHTFPSAVLRAPTTINQDMKALVPKKEILPEFLCALFWATNSRMLELVEKSTHDTRKFQTDKLLGSHIVVPPLPEQRRIVAELDALQAEVDALKRLQAETAAELAALLPAILDKAFKGEL